MTLTEMAPRDGLANVVAAIEILRKADEHDANASQVVQPEHVAVQGTLPRRLPFDGLLEDELVRTPLLAESRSSAACAAANRKAMAPAVRISSYADPAPLASTYTA
jgi:hypothetical protein